MINTERETYARQGLAKEPIRLDQYSEEELLLLRGRIDTHLPVIRLADVNLERELMLQLRAAQALQTRVLDDELTAANQKAQVMNSVASTIQNLIKLQAEQYTPERLKRIENLLVDTLNELPEDMTRDFFQKYEEILKGG